jgi:hypothetical protein
MDYPDSPAADGEPVIAADPSLLDMDDGSQQSSSDNRVNLPGPSRGAATHAVEDPDSKRHKRARDSEASNSGADTN